MMTPTHSFSRFAYFDTNILSELAKQPALWGQLSEYLIREDLTIAVSSQAAELSDASRLHDALSSMLVSLPSAVIKPWNPVLEEEVIAHPEARSESLLLYPLNALLLEPAGPTQIREFLDSADLREARRGQREAAARLPNRHAELKDNFPPGRDGAYVKEQAPLFASLITMQWLAGTHLSFLQQFQDNIEQFREHTIKSVRLYALVLFYKYYLGHREPKRLSDFGDLFHLYPLPYCALAVVERDLANTLAQIRRNDRVLNGTEIRDIDFIRDFAAHRSHGTG
jgi:hypothetical protein